MFTRMKKLSFVLLLIAACLAMPVTGMASQKQLQGRGLDRGHTMALIADEVRHQLVTLPYYNVFDWLEAEVLPDDTVILRGRSTLSSRTATLHLRGSLRTRWTGNLPKWRHARCRECSAWITS